MLLLRDSRVDMDLHSDKRPKIVRAGKISEDGPKHDFSFSVRGMKLTSRSLYL